MTPRRHVSQVNWRKIIDDFRSAYQLRDAWEIVLIELIANSIDAGATEIDLTIAGELPKVLRVIDNGKGMTRSEFGQYHNLGSLTKERGAGIGWAGVGAKLYLDRSASIYSETRSESFEGASKWFLPRGPKGPVWTKSLHARYFPRVTAQRSRSPFRTGRNAEESRRTGRGE